MPQRSATFPKDWFPRHRASTASPEPFVPIRSSVELVREILGHFERDCRIVVLYGPHGTGRSTIARRVGALWSGPVSFLNQPSATFDPGDMIGSDSLSSTHVRSRGKSLRVIDALTLDHADWSVPVVDHLSPGQKVLIVSSTAWWLEFGRILPIRVAGVATMWLDSDEIAHLINSFRWMRSPNAPAVEPACVAKIAAATEGRISEIVRMVGPGLDRLR